MLHTLFLVLPLLWLLAKLTRSSLMPESVPCHVRRD